MKRVLHVHAGNMYGGVETVLEAVHHEQRRHGGVAHEFALCFDGRIRQSLEAAGAVVHDLGPARVSRPDLILRARRRLAGVLRDSAPDVVLTHSSWSQALFGATVRATARPLATWLHDCPDGRHWLQRLAARQRPDLVLANSRFTAQAAGRLYPHVPVDVVHYPLRLNEPVEAEVRARVRGEMGVPEATRVIVQVSRFEPYKGHRVLLDALQLLAGRPDWECWIVGGAQRDSERRLAGQLAARAREAGLDGRMRFLGMRADVTRLLAAADIFCQPNVGPEPFGIVFVEAMNAGLPVVTSGLGAAPEVVPEGCGSLVPPDDAAALARELATYLDDDDRLRRARSLGPLHARALCDGAARLRDLEKALARAAG